MAVFMVRTAFCKQSLVAVVHMSADVGVLILIGLSGVATAEQRLRLRCGVSRSL